MSEKNPLENEDPTWRTHMQMLMKRKRNMEIAQTIDEALFRYYSDKGEEVPNWKTDKNPSWWVEYLKTLGLNERNEPI